MRTQNENGVWLSNKFEIDPNVDAEKYCKHAYDQKACDTCNVECAYEFMSEYAI